MTIKEVSAKYDLSEDALRYYEKIGLLPRVPRTKGGIRNYDDASCNWINFIKCMRSAGVEINALVEYVRLFHKGDSTREARRAILVEQRDAIKARIAEQNAVLRRLNKKISIYDDQLRECEAKLRNEPGARRRKQPASGPQSSNAKQDAQE